MDIKSKGVITRVVPDEDMYTDENGVVVDMVIIPSSASNRMNIGRSHEQTIGASGRDTIKQLRDMAGLDRVKVYEFDYIRSMLSKLDTGLQVQMFEFLLGWYLVASPTRMYPKAKKMIDTRGESQWWLDHLSEVIYDGNEPYGPFIQNPIGCGINYDKVVKEISEGPYDSWDTPLTYRDLGGKVRTTKTASMIGPMYILALEKTATDANGVSVSRVNQFGTAAKLTNADKYAAPVREVGSNHSGESEVRNMAKSVGGEVIAALADMNNDPATIKQVAVNILLADKPTNIDSVLDTSVYRGSHRARDFALQHMYTSGKQFVRPDVNNEE